MKSRFLAVAGIASAVGGMAIAQAERPRLPAECRQQLIAVCRDSAGGGLRQCLATALPKLSDSCRKAVSDQGTARAPAPAGVREYGYGADAAQKLDFVSVAGTAKAPLLVFIHGGGWSIGDKRGEEVAKAAHFTALGWAFASINYRLVPGATVEQQAADIASSIAWLRGHESELGIDPNRIVLMGHSAGAHLAALVGTDAGYMAKAGVPLTAIRGEVLLDGAGYDVAKQMALPGNPVGSMYQAAFGTGPARQRALSPIHHAAAPNVARWLILPIEKRTDSQQQSRALAAALTEAGAMVRVSVVPGESHRSLNKGLGEAGDFATGEVDRFLLGLR